jgi:hypothetical protein
MPADSGPPLKGESATKRYDTYTVTELKDILRERELPVSGTKNELIKRLERHDSLFTVLRAPADMFLSFVMLTAFAYLLYITHHYLQSGPVWYLYSVIGALQLCFLLLVVVFGAIQRTKPLLEMGGITRKMSGKLDSLTAELKAKSQTAKDADITPSPAFVLEKHTGRSLKEIEEEQHAMVSDMEDES